MKFLLVLAVVLLGIWAWRSGRKAGPGINRKQDKVTPAALEMVRCAVCSVHVPAVDAVQGKHGAYCSADHLHRAER